MDEHIFKQLFKSRSVIAVTIILASSCLLIYNLHWLQVIKHSDYQTTSEGNRFDLMTISPPRGLIYDRHGRTLADNRTSYSLEISPTVLNNNITTQELQGLLNLTTQELSRLQSNTGVDPYSNRLVLRSHMSEAEVALLAPELYRIPESEIVGRLARYYPEGDLYSHVIGYVGAISSKDLNRINKKDYAPQDYIGKIGIEKYYESTLRGKPGLRRVEVNAYQKILASSDILAAVEGNDIMLTLDTHLQEMADQALGQHQGAVIALDPRDGSILALVSKPTFDPNLFSYNFSNKEYRQLSADSSLNPFFNRAISGQYAPGSTLKPVVALAALKTNTVSPSYYIYAGPYYQIPGFERHYRDWRVNGHGMVNLSLSITQSCDVFFYDVAHRMGVTQLSTFFADFGLGHRTGVDTTSESAGLVPTPEWKYSKYNETWFPAETIMLGIGQGYLLTTPLQLAVMTATLANRGRKITPHLVRAYRMMGSHSWQYKTPQPPVAVTDNSAADWDYVIDAMVNVVHRRNGTAYHIGQSIDYAMAGKTGTVQTRRVYDREQEKEMELIRELRDHAMFIGFAPPSAPEIAVAVVVEHSGSGSKYAAPVARQVFDAYFSKTAITALEH